MKPTSHSRCVVFFVVGLWALAAHAIEPTVSKLYALNTLPQTTPQFGSSTAVSDKWLLVGEPFNDDKATDAGAVHVFDRATGKWLRKLYASAAKANEHDGASIALSGNLALIGTPGDATQGVNAGAAYVVDVSTGKQLLKLTAADGGVGDSFGTVAMSGSIGLIGAPFHNDATLGISSGAAYIFDLTNGMQLRKLSASDGSARSAFGEHLALQDRIGIVCAQGQSGNAGTAYLFDVLTGMELRKIPSPTGMANDQFGISCALHGNLAFVGSTATGKVYAFDNNTGFKEWEISGTVASFGYSIAVNANLLCVGSPYETITALPTPVPSLVTI